MNISLSRAKDMVNDRWENSRMARYHLFYPYEAVIQWGRDSEEIVFVHVSENTLMRVVRHEVIHVVLHRLGEHAASNALDKEWASQRVEKSPANCEECRHPWRLHDDEVGFCSLCQRLGDGVCSDSGPDPDNCVECGHSWSRHNGDGFCALCQCRYSGAGAFQ